MKTTAILCGRQRFALRDPGNALINSQYEALKKLRNGYERRIGRDFPVSFAKYTGDVQGEARRALQIRPPQILLTNYVMAELFLVRPDDQEILSPAGPDGVRFLVFDELHTYRGRQGADVAMLIRRLKERCAAPDLVCVGTSATMVASRDATPLERRETVAGFDLSRCGITVLKMGVGFTAKSKAPATRSGGP